MIKQEDLKNYFINEKEELPLNFDKNSILNQFTQKIKKDIPAQIVIKIDNKSVSDFYLEQKEKKYQIIEFKQQTKQLLKKALYLQIMKIEEKPKGIRIKLKAASSEIDMKEAIVSQESYTKPTPY